MKKALIIAAHPDDEVLGCGGLISKYRNIVDFKVVFIAEGSSCRFKDPKGEDSLKSIKKRTEDAKKALSFLKINNYEFYDLPCGRLDQIPIIEINKIIEDVIKEFSPDTIYTHSQSDVNNDHKIVHKSSIMATRPVGNNVKRIFSFEILSSSEWAYGEYSNPNYFEALDIEDIESKWKALKIYETEIKKYPFPRSEEGLKALSMMRGMQSGFNYAEAFQLIREFKK